MLLSLQNVSKRFTDRKLLDDVSLIIHKQDKIGVIGMNGAGKSTLLHIMAQTETIDEGILRQNGSLRIALCDQSPVFSVSESTLDYVLRNAFAKQDEVKEYEAKSILTKLGIRDFDRDVMMLSGGQKKRVSLACALIAPCDLLILDEPTNHLDHNMVLWLEKYLMKYNKAVLMVTHDRYFLERICDCIVELAQGKLYRYDANYSTYLELKALRELEENAVARKRKSMLQRESLWMRQGAKARSTKSKDRIERFNALCEQQEKTSGSLQLSSVFTRLGRKTIDIEHISKRFGELELFHDFTHSMSRFSCVGIVGENGCGKSTLLKMIVGEILPDSGTITLGETVNIGYFTQEARHMDASQRVIDYIKNIAEIVETLDGVRTAAQMLEDFLFTDALQWNTIGRLSGGERRRLELLGVLMGKPNILLLDEPTNDLDIQTMTILEDYLQSFPGAVFMVSHDRYFLDKVADELIIFEDGTINKFPGEYSDYLHMQTLKEKEDIVKPDRIVNMGKRRLNYQEQKEWQSIEEDIAELESALQTIDQQLAQETQFERLRQLGEERTKKECALEQKFERWTYLSDIVEETGK